MRHIIHFIRDIRNMPVGCVAFRDTIVSETERLVDYGYSIYNPADKWNRRVARDIAIGRMEKNPITVRVSSETNKLNIGYLIDQIYIDLAERDIPRLSKEAKRRQSQLFPWEGSILSEISKSLNLLSNIGA